LSETRRAWSGIGILTLFFVILLILQMVSPYLGWSDPEVEDGFVIDEVVSGLGGPACLEWVSDRDLLVCDRDGDVIRLLNFDLSEDEWKPTELSFTLLTNVHEPHDILILDDHILVSERGKLTRINQTVLDSTLDDAPRWTIIDDIPTGNHQTNNLDIMPNGTVIWHVGSTCNICDEVDERNAALLWVNSSTGAHGILASGVRNSFHGIWVPDMGYIFSDNGRDWEGDHPPEEINLLIPSENYGWPDDDPDHPVPEGTIGPIATWTPHSSLNNLAYRPPNSSFPGGNHTVYATVFGSWNAIVPVGHEIVRIDFTENASEPQGWSSETSVFASDLSGPLPIVFHPSGDFLFYTNFLDDGTLYVISSS
tara:strand:- start:2077 stop:3174 length:1098 start_codon:yes stop_codon:yes gene_type:complete